jgi:hypothetical protein
MADATGGVGHGDFISGYFRHSKSRPLKTSKKNIKNDMWFGVEIIESCNLQDAIPGQIPG